MAARASACGAGGVITAFKTTELLGPDSRSNVGFIKHVLCSHD
jgi:hypothetical protein